VRTALDTWFAVSLLGAASSCGGARALRDDAPSPAGEPEPRGTHTADASASDATTADDGLRDTDDSHSPAEAATSRRALAIAIGEAHACVLLDDQTVRCWGSGVTSGDPGPPRPAIAIAAAFQTTCAILDDGSVTCWAPGAGSTWEQSNVSIDLGAGRRAVSLTMAPREGACAVLDDGSARCWGGEGAPTAAPKTLSPLDGGPRVVQLGLNEAGEILALYGDGTVGEGAIFGLTPGRLLEGRPTATIATQRGDTGWCAMLVGGGSHCEYIPDYFGANALPATALTNQITMTDSFVCGIRPNGTVSCWVVGGDDPECDDGSMYWCRPGRNGDGSYDVALDRPAISVASGTAGSPIACAVLLDGSVRCWGLTASASSDCNVVVSGRSVCDAILGHSVEVVRTDAGLRYGPWRAIDLGAPP
jgi:hypothetical protein